MSSPAELELFSGIVRDLADDYVFDLIDESPHCSRVASKADKYIQLGFTASTVRLARIAGCVEAVSRIDELSSIVEITDDDPV